MAVKKIDFIKIAEEALQTVFPRVSFGPPGAEVTSETTIQAMAQLTFIV